MTNGNYVKISTILSEIRNYPFVEGITQREAAHSLVTLLGLIGATIPLERKYKIIEIKQHKGQLPNDIMYIHGVNNKGPACTNRGIPMRYATDIYNSALHSDAAKAECAGQNVTASNVEEIAEFGEKTVDRVYIKYEDGQEQGILAGKLSDSDILYSSSFYIDRGYYENSYSINGTSIDTSFADGYVEIAYDGVKLDENGLPMIPDDKAFRQAFKYFLLKNAVEPEFFRGNVTQMVYAEINKQYDWYVGAAGNSFNMPSPDQLESMINGLVRILPSRSNVDDGWKSFNKPERFR